MRRDLPSSTANKNDVTGTSGSHTGENSSHGAERAVEVDFHLGAHFLLAIQGDSASASIFFLIQRIAKNHLPGIFNASDKRIPRIIDQNVNIILLRTFGKLLVGVFLARI